MTSRRNFLRMSATAAAAAGLPASIQKALALPAISKTGTINDVKHVVILMQENRGFDHYFGTLNGVRGYGDARPTPLPSGAPVWYQPNGKGGYVLPFHLDTSKTSAQQLGDMDHSWTGTHSAWNNGKYDGWVTTKGQNAMGYFKRADIPYHYALADAFTICDAYHCSIMASTDPNRYYLWTGWAGNDGKGNGPVIDNSEAGNYAWTTYPERLQAANISWRVYQDPGIGLNAAGSWGWTSNPYIGNYGDNSLLYFQKYQDAKPGSALYTNAVTGYSLADLKKDVINNTLPQVSWIAAPEAFTEHPSWTPGYGARYISEVLDALTSNPDVWGSTVFFINYDENDGFFDHDAPPVPPASSNQGKSTVDTVNEFFAGNSKYAAGAYGLAQRVPMLAISPWSKGGWVSSEVFDHTSVIRFLEKRFGVMEPNITPWRRSICGDLTSLFDFKNPNGQVPTLPNTSLYTQIADSQSLLPSPTVPSVQVLPVQESGQRPTRPVPYELFVQSRQDPIQKKFWLDFANSGLSGAAFRVYAGNRSDGPWFYTVGAGAVTSDYWTGDDYNLAVYGPNGFLRVFHGNLADTALPKRGNPDATLCYDVANGNVILTLSNRGTVACTITVQANTYSTQRRSYTVQPGTDVQDIWDLKNSHGWYDLSVVASTANGFLRRFAGHVEDGKNSMSDPAFGTMVSLSPMQCS
ncbi:phosphocholine-specific phospholipase C [Aquirhabdus parva]|uniref:phospholipase C n=1 Tax=Aquirhabdus parva TaxID=2283318 RepID=A0A345P961_9GAMM|nr:phospholipase C, phosphocholine-specific [Aquirhabdus parva]AXI03820.1 phospholipase C, phosphocholine-specific [Aquirhabdus parva]